MAIDRSNIAGMVKWLPPTTQAANHLGLGQQVAENTHQVPQSLYDTFSSWARGEISNSVVRSSMPSGWTIDRRLNTSPHGVGVFDPSGNYHFIGNDEM